LNYLKTANRQQKFFDTFKPYRALQGLTEAYRGLEGPKTANPLFFPSSSPLAYRGSPPGKINIEHTEKEKTN
jgi:hypothetical protein